MAAHIPNEIRFEILEALVGDTRTSAYAWPPKTQSALLQLAHVDRSWRAVSVQYLYRRVVLHSSSQILALLSFPDHHKFVESLCLIPGRVDRLTAEVSDPRHDYCTGQLQALLQGLSSTLERLFIMHSYQEDEGCTYWPQAVSALTMLQELVVESCEALFPYSLITTTEDEEQGADSEDEGQARALEEEHPHEVEPLVPYSPLNHSPRCSPHALRVSYTGSDGQEGTASNRDTEASEYVDSTRLIPSWPTLPRLRRLATSGYTLWWRDTRFTTPFPLINHLVFCDYVWIEDAESQVQSMRRQLRENALLKGVIVEQDRPYFRRDWRDDARRLPVNRFLFHLYTASEGQGSWLLRMAILGGIFDVGQSFLDLRASPEP